MPKNKGKGGKNRKRGTNKNEPTKRELVLKEPGQEYAQCTKMLGNGRIECMCFDGVKRLATIRGKMRKKVWVNVGDVILLGLRDYQDGKADVIMKYMPEEARKLQKKGHIPETAKIDDEGAAEAREGWDYDDGAGSEDEDSEEEVGKGTDYLGAISDSDDDSDDDDDEDKDDDDEEEEESEEEEKPQEKQRNVKFQKGNANQKGGNNKKMDADFDIDNI